MIPASKFIGKIPDSSGNLFVAFANGFLTRILIVAARDLVVLNFIIIRIDVPINPVASDLGRGVIVTTVMSLAKVIKLVNGPVGHITEGEAAKTAIRDWKWWKSAIRQLVDHEGQLTNN